MRLRVTFHAIGSLAGLQAPLRNHCPEGPGDPPDPRLRLNSHIIANRLAVIKADARRQVPSRRQNDLQYAMSGTWARHKVPVQRRKAYYIFMTPVARHRSRYAFQA